MNTFRLPLRCRWLLLCTISVLSAESEISPNPGPANPPEELRLSDKFDRDGNRVLDASERREALAYLDQQPAPVTSVPSGRPTDPLPLPVSLEPVRPGEKINPANAAVFPEKPLYDEGTLRTVFLTFDDAAWEKELTAFARTDIAVSAQLKFDGHDFSGVGVRFRMPETTAVTSAGYKRGLILTLDQAVSGQSIAGQRQLVLLDAGTDPTLLRTVLYSHIARQYVPAPRANFVRVVINGEFWGTYVSVQPFDENFTRENFHSDAGARWSVSAGGSLEYLGDKPGAYRAAYHQISPENPSAQAALRELCKLITETPAWKIESALSSRLDIDGALRFFALENTLINRSGYSGGTGNYGLYLATDGRFHLIPEDSETSFRLIEVSEYGERSHRSRAQPETRAVRDATAPSGKSDRRGNDRANFPKQTGTDLAMLLSYSFINKADADLDGRVTKAEWLDFARVWFLVMDEDLVGKLTQDQFLLKFRNLLTPASIADGRTKQTFGGDDPAAVIGGEFFKALDRNHDGQLTGAEMSGTLAEWFDEWKDPKSGVMTEPTLQRGFEAFLSRTVFEADQTYIAGNKTALANKETGDRGRGRGRRGGGQGGGSGAGISVGPLHVGGRGRGAGSKGSRELITFGEQLDPLAALDDTAKPLATKLLSVPALRKRYLEYVREIAETWLSWEKLGPIATGFHQLIAADVARETHKAGSYEHFVQEFDQDTSVGGRDGDAVSSLKNFAKERRKYLLNDDRVTGGGESP